MRASIYSLCSQREINPLILARKRNEQSKQTNIMRFTKTKSVLRNGRCIARVIGEKGQAEFWKNYESRGYQTGFQPKEFFYIVTGFERGQLQARGIKHDPRLRGLLDFWNKMKFHFEILDNGAFNEMTTF